MVSLASRKHSNAGDFPYSSTQWMEVFASRIDFARGEALLADEKLMLKLKETKDQSKTNEKTSWMAVAAEMMTIPMIAALKTSL